MTVMSSSTSNNNEEEEDPNPHAAQWERQEEWLTKLRAHKKTLEENGVQGFDLLEAMATLGLDHKMALASKHRCLECWHETNHCICSQLLSKINLEGDLNTVTICILMHHKEYLGAGNSAKLLLSLLPNHTELYLFGKQGEVDRLYRDISNTNAMILWPSSTAMSAKEFIEAQAPAQPIIKAIVLDGTYTQARNMHKSLRKRWGVDQMPPAVAVQPQSESVFHRAQKNYGQAHQQQHASARRVSTAEACGWLWTELGAPRSVQETIVEAVLVNNQALAFARTSEKKKRAGVDGGDGKGG